MVKRGGKIPESMFGRTRRLLWTGARIAGQELGGRLAEKLGDAPDSRLATKIRQTEELVRTLSELKGAAMKAGQLLSLEFGDLLPKEVVDVMRTLHDDGTSLDISEVEKILKQELGPKFAELDGLTPEPIAAASIGQVHKAVLGGRPVAVKIQYPGVAISIDSDLAVLKKTAQMLVSVRGKTIDLTPMFAELAEGLKREADYLQEATNLETYRQAMRHEAFLVPEVFREFTTKRVLTMSFESGERISGWLAQKPDHAAVQRFGGLILELIFEEFFVNGIVQTDPNYGNFLYRPAESRLVLLDFGATNSYAAAFRDEIRQILGAAVDRDDIRVLEVTKRLNLLDPREAAEVQTAYLELIRRIADVFQPENQPVKFSDGVYLQDLRTLTYRFIQTVRYSPPARQLLFLNRKLGGMFHLLKDAGAELDLSRYLDRVMTMDIKDS